MLVEDVSTQFWQPEGNFSGNANPLNDGAKILVVGSGPVGMHFVECLLQKKPLANIRLFGNEPVAPYNRVQLSALLAGDIFREQINLPLPSGDNYPNFRFSISNIKKIDRANSVIQDNQGQYYQYDVLVLATGAKAHVPAIPGRSHDGVYRFRSIADTELLFARISRCRHVVVLGGGLLGLEAAKALLRSGTKVTVIQQGSHLMNRQLDEKAASMLRADVEKMGIQVITNAGGREIIGEGRVSGIRTNDDQEIPCDTVLICSGISPNIQIALDAQVAVGRGILVNDQLQTADPNIYAIGECCEHKGRTYGLVSPGYEQAAVAANIIANKKAVYEGSLSVSRLKVVGQSVCSMGEVVDVPWRPRQKVLCYENKKDNIYRKLVVVKGRVIGAVAYGEWPESPRVQSVFQECDRIWPWQQLYFRLTGYLWSQDGANDLSLWPEKSIVCQCRRVSKGALISAIKSGYSELDSLQEQTSAGSVCGSCKPLLVELLGAGQATPKELGWGVLLLSSLLALVFAAIVFFWPEAQVANSVQEQDWAEHIWNDKFMKQVTGFSLLGMTIVGLLMSLRKRIKSTVLGKFAYWRLLHTVLGLLCAVTLVFHTGFHLGSNLNQLLMINFLLLLVLGSSAGAVISLGHKLRPMQAKKLRKVWTWAHIFISWPLPALLASHVFSVYYF